MDVGGKVAKGIKEGCYCCIKTGGGVVKWTYTMRIKDVLDGKINVIR